jgi:phage/conjugal plasmid C-4 type zinc finger TraR family protein
MDNADLSEKEEAKLLEATLLNISNKLKDSGVSDCIECGNDIGLKRKTAMPSATMCIDCQEINEG